MTYEAFQAQFNIRLNAQQEAAVRHVDGPALLLAVPGSGKTTVIVTRLGYLIHCLGADPRSLLTVTYTRAATGDMRRRYVERFGGAYAGALSFRTLNGISHKIVEYYARTKRRMMFSLLQSDADAARIIRGQYAAQGADYPSDQEVREIRRQITYCKNMMCTAEEIGSVRMEKVNFPALYQGYCETLRAQRLMDYDDQMVIAYKVLRLHPDILARFQDQYRYLSVDEAQDTSKIQHAILRLLAGERRNLFLVGDEDQSVYGFRAAYPQALLDFEADYPGAKVLLMETNYRSTGEIVERADTFIRLNQCRHAKHMRTENGRGEPIQLVKLADYSGQYAYLAKVAEGCEQSTAVLYRNNDSALPLIDLLEQKGIPYACRQRESFFFTSPLVRDLTDMLRFAWDGANRALFLSFYYKLDLKIKKEVLARLLRGRPGGEPVLDGLTRGDGLESWQLGKLRALKTHFAKLPNLTSFDALQQIVKYMGYGTYLSDQHADLSRLYILLSLAAQNRNPGAFLARLEFLRDVLEGPDRYPDCPFVLSTIHSSKGLEYDRVILIDVVDGLFPAVPELREGKPPAAGALETLEEERRLFYVGVTRARYRVELLRCERRFDAPTEPASFLTQLLGLPEPGEPADTGAAGAYQPGTQVTHRKFGPGILQSRAGGIAVVAFQDGSVRKLDLAACIQKKLLRLSDDT